MALLRENWNIDQYADFEKHWRWLQPDKTPLDLTGYVFKVQFRDSLTGVLLDEFDSLDIGGISVNLSTAQIDFFIPGAQTAGYTWNSAKFDMLVVSLFESKWRLIEGNAVISHGETQP